MEFSVLDHVLVPKHRILSEEEKRSLLEKFNISEVQLPKILSTDPAVKALGAKPGDVIEIERPSPTAGKTLYYRLVVRG